MEYKAPHNSQMWHFVRFRLAAHIMADARCGKQSNRNYPLHGLDLLFKKYWEGRVTRRYHHELEAFIWMLPFVFLAYDNGELDRQISLSNTGSPLTTSPAWKESWPLSQPRWPLLIPRWEVPLRTTKGSWSPPVVWSRSSTVRGSDRA